ncbi:MAG: LysM peptidoglycan-binding domain-containing protein [Oceanospirillaceae bacterium]
MLKEDFPDQYKVKKGDTLWDIAGVFLNSPWLWPSIWEQNHQIKNPHLIYPNDTIYLLYKNGQPYLSTTKDGVLKLSPKIRLTDRFSPITAIPREAIQAFIENNRIVEAGRINKMPYILANAGLRELISSGDEVFIKGVLDPDFNEYHIYRAGNDYGTDEGLEVKNTEIVKVGTLVIIEMQDGISKAKIIRAKGLIKKGDFLVRSQELNLKPFYYLAAAPEGVTGKILSPVNDALNISRYDGVVLNLGEADGLYPGHVFNIAKAPRQVKDPRTSKLVTIGSQVVGELMVVSVFKNLSYGIVLNAKDLISAGDYLQSVK